MSIAARLVPPRPVPPARPLSPLRLGMQLGRNVLGVWTEDIYAADVTARPFFGRRNLTLSAPEAIRHVFVDNNDGYGRTRITRRMLVPILERGLFLAEGAEWRHQRRSLAPAFTPRAIDPLRPAMSAIAAEGFAALGDGAPALDLFDFTQRLTLAIAARTMFSLEMADRAPRMRSLVDAYAAVVGPSLFDLLLPDGWPNPTDWRRNAAARRLAGLIEDLMRERSAAGGDGEVRDLFDLMLRARDPDTGRGFGHLELRDQVATMILAGHETTAIALFWSLLLLALDPGAQDRAAAEVLAWSGDNGTSLTVQLPYLTAVTREAMRLYPPAFLVTREALRPDTIAGHAVEPGDMISVSPWLVHRNARRWPDPHSFDPDRFMPGGPAVDRLAYIPFGLGPRVCIGAHFAETELVLALAEGVRRFRFARVDERPVMPVAVVTLRPDHNALFRLTRR